MARAHPCRPFPLAQRQRNVDEIRLAMREGIAGIPGARMSIGLGSPGEKMNLMLAGDEPATLEAAARAVRGPSAQAAGYRRRRFIGQSAAP